MSEIKLVVRDEMRDVSVICHGSDAHRVVAALSADPFTIDELEAALQRFMTVDRNEFFHGAEQCIDDAPWDSGVVVIDLAARLITVNSTYFTTTHSGQVYFRNADECTNTAVGYSLLKNGKSPTTAAIGVNTQRIDASSESMEPFLIRGRCFMADRYWSSWRPSVGRHSNRSMKIMAWHRTSRATVTMNR
jgi:hypothetical protein